MDCIVNKKKSTLYMRFRQNYNNSIYFAHGGLKFVLAKLNLP